MPLEQDVDEAWIHEVLGRHEPAAVRSQLPVAWRSATGSCVTTEDGRMLLDWTSGILTANAGHAPPSVVQAIQEQAARGLLHTYAFPTAVRATFVRALVELTGFEQVVLLTTGAEAVEAALKIARSRAMQRGRSRALVVSFDGAFHGRTMGAQLAGGLPHQRHWVVDDDETFVRVPFPDRTTRWSVDLVDEALERHGNCGRDVACVLVEPYQGSTLAVMGGEAARAIRRWCDEHDVLLVLDEVQSGFGRTGALFGYERLGIRPDVLLCGKGLSGSLPMSAVLVADASTTSHLAVGELGNTHGGNPVVLAAAQANLELFRDGALLAAARALGHGLERGLRAWEAEHPGRRRVVECFGAVAGITLLRADGSADRKAAVDLVSACLEGGLLMCTPTGPGGTLVKVMPPLTTSTAELTAALDVLVTASEAIGG